MKSKCTARISLMMAALIFQIACGTQDYAPEPSDTAAPANGNRTPSGSKTENQVPLIPKTISPGYLWRGFNWVGLPEELVSSFKCSLEDDPGASDFSGFGATVLGGAILGVVIRSSGSWFLGKPVEPGPGHWFWNRLDETIKTVSQGAVRGALMGGVCETLLAGGNLTPLAGILGQNFSALSSAIVLGGGASIAVAPFIANWMREDPSKLDVVLSDAPSIGDRDWKAVAAKLNEWSKTSEMGRGLRYRIAPGLTILGIGGGVVVIIYNWLQPDSQVDGRKNDCGQAP